MRISDWSSDVCSSDLEGRARRRAKAGRALGGALPERRRPRLEAGRRPRRLSGGEGGGRRRGGAGGGRASRHRGRQVGCPCRSEERRVGKACVSALRSRRSPNHTKKKQNHKMKT